MITIATIFIALLIIVLLFIIFNDGLLSIIDIIFHKDKYKPICNMIEDIVNDADDFDSEAIHCGVKYIIKKKRQDGTIFYDTLIIRLFDMATNRFALVSCDDNSNSIEIPYLYARSITKKIKLKLKEKQKIREQKDEEEFKAKIKERFESAVKDIQKMRNKKDY